MTAPPSHSPLHTVHTSPSASDALPSCLRHLTPGAALLLLEDGVYGALAGGSAAAAVAAAAVRHPVYVLGPDLVRRGLGSAALVEGVKMVDYAAFVDLATRHYPVQAWF